MPMRPDFREVSAIEERALSAQLDAVRATVDHAGEKGHALEVAVSDVIRAMLPAEYGVGSGFVAWLPKDEQAPRVSQQLDVIIFDAQRCHPLIRVGSLNVYPLEGVFGYIEVKASISSSPGASSPAHHSVESIAIKNREIRAMKRRVYWSSFVGSPASTAIEDDDDWLSLRSYVVAFDFGSGLTDLGAVAQRLSDAQRMAGSPAHIHGVFVPRKALLTTRAVDARIAKPEDYWQVQVTQGDSLLKFKAMLLHHLASFQRPWPEWRPAYDRYFFDDLPPSLQQDTPVED